MFLKRLLKISINIVLLFSMVACNDFNLVKREKIKVGVSMPTKKLQRWNFDGQNLKKNLNKYGYNVDLDYANNSISTQASQIENMIDNDCKLLIISPVDCNSLGSALEDAKTNKIPVISYDRLIMDSNIISYYATFDNYKIGQIQGKYIVDKLNLEKKKGPFNIELFTGSFNDNNCRYFFSGAMDVLQKYIDNGKLVIKSGQTSFETVETPNWSSKKAEKRMDNILKYYYENDKIDAVLASNDSVASGIIKSLKGKGYTKNKFPIVTGQDCDIEALKNLKEGTQSMSVFKDTRELANQVAIMANQILNNQDVDVNNRTSYNNGNKRIATYLCKPIFIDKNNYKQVVIGSRYYTNKQLQ